MSSKKRLDIQGLRALAILAVLICHMNPSWLPGGYLGADVFFVVSGYVVTKSIAPQTGHIHLGKFYISRVRRIIPLYVTILALTTLGSALLLLPADFSIYNQSLQKAALFLSNNYFAHYGDYFSPDTKASPLLHTWSLAIEMQFYLLLPLLLKMTPRRHWKTMALMVGAFSFTLACMWDMNPQNKLWIYYSPFTRAPELLAGVVLALYSNTVKLEHKKIFGIAEFLLIALTFALANERNFSPATAMAASLGAAAIIISENNSSAISRFITSRTMVTIGALSYSIHLWHWPYSITSI